jgi:hypothetical protein
MSNTGVVESLVVTEAVLNYLASTSERPRTYTYDPPADERSQRRGRGADT